MSKTSHEHQLAELKREYINSLPDKLIELKSAWEHLQFVNWDQKKLEKLKFLSHELVGVGANLGYPDISTAAKLLDEQLRPVTNQANPNERTKITKHLALLEKFINYAVSSYSVKPDTIVPPSTPFSGNVEQSSIAIIEDDKTQAEFLKIKLHALGYSVATFSSPSDFANDQNKNKFDLIILDVSFPEGPLEGLFWLEHIHEQIQTHCPIIITSARSDFVARMRAVRAGASAYLSKPINIEDLHKQISYCLKLQKTSEMHVLCVDDDSQIQKLYKILLENEGFTYEGLTQPLKIIESMVSFQPDIIIMDYEMPGCNGGEIATMLRQDIRFMTTPIIFASGSNKAIAHQGQLSILGDAFITKPFDKHDLLTQIKTQLKKAKYVSRKIEQVSQRTNKNGLQTKRFFLEKLETFLYKKHSDTADEDAFLVYATIDNIDYLQERFGLKNLATLNSQLENYLSGHTLIQGNGCSIGNASFLIQLRIDKSEDETLILKTLQNNVEQQSWSVDDKSCKLTLSMGALKLQQNNTLDKVITSVEQACFHCMTIGGNRIEWVKSEENNQDILNDKIKGLMREQSFKLYYQPIVNLETDVVLFEALIRLQDQEGNIFSPDQFMPWIDEELEGGSNTLDRWLIEQAVCEIQKIALKQNQTTSIIIKLSSSLAQLVGLLPEIRFAVQQNKMTENGKLIFALPISSVIKDIHKSKQFIESLHELGCGFMLEKVENSEAHLKLIHDIGKLDFAKINVSEHECNDIKRFISQIQKNNNLAPTLVAAGIEDSSMLAQYWEQGIRNFQGYFIQKPGEESSYKDGET